MKSESLWVGRRNQHPESFLEIPVCKPALSTVYPTGIWLTSRYYYHFAKGKQSQRSYVTCPRQHSLEEPDVNHNSRPPGSPRCLISFSLKSIIYKALAKDAEESGESTTWVIVSSSVVVSQSKSALLFYMAATMSNRLVPHRLKAYEV